MKVKILPKVSVWNYKGKSYHPDDIVDIPNELFVPSYMESLEAKPQPIVVESSKEEAEWKSDESQILDAEKAISEEKPEKRGRKSTS